ncbi:MAG TPA: MFS transporter [Streptosporangiaceae bacterium]|nr:MFS transporter [Streptosporangiaceae bacterium]
MSRYSLGAYLGGATVARTADEMSGPALLLLGLAVTGSARTAALLYAALTIAGGCGGPLFGVLLDRSPAPGRLLAGALAGYAAGLAVVAISLGHQPVIVVAALAAAAGFLAPSITGGWTSRLADILPAPRLARGYSLDVGTYSAAALIGPALAGLVAGAAGAGWAMAAAVALLLVAAPAAGRLPRRSVPNSPAPSRPANPGPSVLADLRAGFGAIVRVRPLLRITACSVIAYVGVGMLFVAYPLLGQRHLGGADRGALLLSLLAAVSLATNAVLSRWPPRLAPDTVFALATALAGLAYASLAVAPSAGWVIAAVVLAGIADGPQLSAVFAIRHREAPDRLRAQVFTTGASLKIVAGSLGAALAGHLAASPPVMLAVAAATQVAALAVFVILRDCRPAGLPCQAASP